MALIVTETRGRVGHRAPQPAGGAERAERVADARTPRALAAFDGDDGIGAIVLTGSERAFAAGADVEEMKDFTAASAAAADYGAAIQGVAATGKPIVAAVAGHCLGGGLELAMMCDIIIAADSARFAQPEITLGIIPGMGGTQRLTRAIGKAKAMEMILTGRTIDAAEAERAGLVARVVPAAELFEAALTLAARIAALPRRRSSTAKAAVNAAFEAPLGEGLATERRLFHRALRYRRPEGRHGGVPRQTAARNSGIARVSAPSPGPRRL